MVLNNNLSQLNSDFSDWFGVTEDGQRGWKEPGADTVTPFFNFWGTVKNLMTLWCVLVPGENELLIKNNSQYAADCFIGCIRSLSNVKKISVNISEIVLGGSQYDIGILRVDNRYSTSGASYIKALNFSTPGTKTLDVSDLDGDYYVYLHINGTSASSMTINSFDFV